MESGSTPAEVHSSARSFPARGRGRLGDPELSTMTLDLVPLVVDVGALDLELLDDM